MDLPLQLQPTATNASSVEAGTIISSKDDVATPSSSSSSVVVSVEPSGCVVEWEEDKSLVIASIACFVSFVVYGAALSSLGAAIPILAVEYDIHESDLSGAFAIRGIGYFIGTIFRAVLLEGFYTEYFDCIL